TALARETLLAGDPSEIVVDVARTDEPKRRRTVHGHATGGEVHPGVAVRNRLIQVHRHAVQRLHDVDEPGEINFDIVVNRDVGEFIDRLDQAGRSSDIRALTDGVGRIDLAGRAVAPLYPQVPWERHHGGTVTPRVELDK